MALRLVFVLVMAIITEATYTTYVYFGSRGDRVRAPISAGLLGVFKAVLVILYVREPIMIAALSVGQMVGTYLMLEFIRNRKST